MLIAVSECLLGVNCRYNGETKRNSWVADELSKKATLIGFCPEHAAFGTPRTPMFLTHVGDQTRIVEHHTLIDRTEKLEHSIETILETLRQTPVDGFILKARSPSCGLCVDLCDLKAQPTGETAPGVFAATLLNAFPHLPITDEEHPQGFIERAQQSRS